MAFTFPTPLFYCITLAISTAIFSQNMDFSNILPYNLEPEYTEDELREIESMDRANLCEDGPD